MDKVVTSDMLVGGDCNGHVGNDVGGLGAGHVSFGIEQINDGGIKLLDWAVSKGLPLMNDCSRKRKVDL